METEQALNPLEKALTEILNKGVAGVEKGVNFLSAELPEVIEQLLLWKACYSVIELLAGLLLIFACFKIPFIVYKKYKFAEWDDYVQIPVVIIGGLTLMIAFIGGICLINFRWLQIWIAPKIYLIEYAAKLIK